MNYKDVNDNDLIIPDNEEELSPEKSKLIYGFTIAKALTATVAFSLAVAGTLIKALHGDFSNIAKIAKATISLAFNAASLRTPIEAFQAAKNKVINKLESNKFGKALSTTLSTVLGTLTSTPVKRAYKIAMTILALASAPTPLGIAIGAIALVSVVYNITKECLQVRRTKRFQLEKSLLEQNKLSISQHKQLLNDQQSTVTSPDLQAFLKKRAESSINQTSNSSIPKKAFSKTRGFLNTLRDNIIGSSSVILSSLDGDIIEQTAAAVSIFGGITTEAESNFSSREKEKKIIGEINELKSCAEPYKSLTDLKEIIRQKKIEEETLKRFLKDPHIENLTYEELNTKFSTIRKAINEEAEFSAPSTNIFQRFASSVKNGFSYFKESQLQGLIDLYTNNKETISDNSKTEIELASLPLIPFVEKKTIKDNTLENYPTSTIEHISKKDLAAVTLMRDTLIKESVINPENQTETAAVYSKNPYPPTTLLAENFLAPTIDNISQKDLATVILMRNELENVKNQGNKIEATPIYSVKRHQIDDVSR